MADKSAGEASVKIVPNAKNFITDLENDLKRRKAEFAVNVSADVTRARTDIDVFRAEQERKPVRVRVETDRASLDKIKSDLAGAGAALGSALKFNLGAAGIGELPALATAITTVAGSMQQLAGAGAVLPGVFAGLGADALTAKIAVMGVGDAFKAMDKASDGSAKNVQAANEALAKLAPQTADFVREVYGIKPAFDSFQKDISGKFFDDLGKSVKNLATADLPVLQRGLGGIATAFNQNLKQLGSSLGSDSSKGLLDRILGNTGDAQARLSKAIDPIVHAFGTLAATGSDALPRLADGVGKVADRFDHFITAADANGSLKKWIDEGLDGFDHLGNTLLNIGKIFTDITTAAGGGGGLLQTLDTGAQKLHDFLSSTEGQNTLSKFFQEGRDDLQQLLPILENLGPIATSAFQAAHDATQIWAPVIKEVTDVLARDPDLVRAIADAFLAWKFVGVITGVADAVKGITTALGFVGPAAATAGSTAAAGLAPLAAVLGTITAAFAFITGGTAAYFAGTKGDSPFPGVSTPTDPQGKLGLQDRNNTGTIVNGVPSSAGDPIFNPNSGAPAGPPSSTRGAATNDIPLTPQQRAAAQQNTTPLVIPGVAPVAPGAAVQPPSTALDPRKSYNPFAGYAGGGPISGRGSGTSDSIPAMLSNGEHVLSAADVKAMGGQAGVYAFRKSLPHMAGGGNPLDFLSIATGAAPGGTAPGPADGGASAESPGGFFGRLFGGLFGGNKSDGSTKKDPGEWLGEFGAKTLLSFGSTLYQGALGLVGLQDSVLSPSNPWFQDATKGLGGVFGQDGLFGKGTSDSATGGKAATSKQLREANEKVADKNSAVSVAQARISELPADAKQSQRLSAQSQLDKANREAGDAQTDLQNLTQYGTGGTSAQQAGLAGATAAGLTGNKAVAYQAMLNAGFAPSEWPALQNLLNGESGFRSDAKNPSSSAYGMFQFLDSTWSSVGGAKTKDPGLQSQYGLQYIKQRYGSPSKAWAFWQAQSPHWYASGGGVQGSGSGDTIPAMLTPGEHVLTTSDVKALGGQENVYAMRAHLALGGDPLDALLPTPPPKPNFQTPNIQKLAPPKPAGAPSKPAPSSVPKPVAIPPAPPGTPPPPNQKQQTFQPEISAQPSNLNHNAPGVSLGIKSGASAIGNLASAAISAAAGAGSFGLGGGGGAGLGQFVSGLIQEGGKAVDDLVNVGSSFLVGNITPGTQGENAYGTTEIPRQQQPATAVGRPINNTFYGHDAADVMNQWDTWQSQDAQATLATARG